METTSAAGFGVNGRFLAQPMTGVQRYGCNVISAMSRHLKGSPDQAPIIAPKSTADPNLASMPLMRVGPFGSHAWEQTSLPLHWKGPLLNLCNTGPAMKINQVICIHDANVFTSPQSYSFAFRQLYRNLQPFLAQRVMQVATVSTDSARQIAKHLSIRAADIAILPNGHEHALDWNPARAEKVLQLEANGSVRSERAFVLVLGSRAHHKNLQLVMDLAPQLADLGVDVVVAGGSTAHFQSVALASSSNVKHVGYVSDDDLAWLMQRALCLAFPSWTEGFGIPIVEAFARGCPVVSSNTASMPDICGDAALLAAPDDPDAWMRHIARLKASPSLGRELVDRGYERARRFSWAETARGYLELMETPARRRTKHVDGAFASRI